MPEKNPYHIISMTSLLAYLRIGLLSALCLLFLTASQINEVENTIEIKLNPIVSFDDVPVDFIVNGYLDFETNVIITESNEIYIDIEDLFRDLGIKCVMDQGLLTGFIDKESNAYIIDYKNSLIKVGNKNYKVQYGIIEEAGIIYVSSTVITKAFGLSSIFNFRSLSIKMEADFELPVMKQERLEQMRRNISRLQSKELAPDTIVRRDYNLFEFGMFDWMVSSYQKNDKVVNNRVAVGLGTELLYGQANVAVYYDDLNEFDKEQFYYNWLWVDNEKKAIRQAQAGKVFDQSISFLEAPIVGGSISNAPTTVRKASGYYTITDYTEPNWSVELYINEVLVDYTDADASGLYVFRVPIVYGYTTIKLKFYGPMGEERIEERTKNVPFTFLPAKTLEYKVTGGVLQDDEGSHYGRAIVDYGITSTLAVGLGLEYLSSIADHPYIPSLTLAFQPFNKMVLNLEYAHNVMTKGLLSYNFANSAFLEVDYTDYVDGQQATLFSANEELKARLSIPYKKKQISGFSKFSFNQYAYDAYRYNQMDAVFSAYYKNYSANLSNIFNWVDDRDAYMSSILAMSYRMNNGIVFRPSTEYGISRKQFTRYRMEIEKRVKRAYFSVYYERNDLNKTDNVFLSFRYDLPFARVGASASYKNQDYYFSESASGSLAFGGDNNYVKAGNISSVGRGGILFYPFLDQNQNGIKDEGEQMVLVSNVRVAGGRANISEKDSIVRISDLNAFRYYTVEFCDDDLENIAWKFKHKRYQVMVDPNHYKRIYLPVQSVGEVSGSIMLKRGEKTQGIGRMVVQIFDDKGEKVAETLSERDGYFSYVGLESGDYTIKVDSEQLELLKFITRPIEQTISVEGKLEGDFIDDLAFEMESTIPQPDYKLIEPGHAELALAMADTESVMTEMDDAKAIDTSSEKVLVASADATLLAQNTEEPVRLKSSSPELVSAPIVTQETQAALLPQQPQLEDGSDEKSSVIQEDEGVELAVGKEEKSSANISSEESLWEAHRNKIILALLASIVIAIGGYLRFKSQS